MQQKWVVAIALAMWAVGVASHATMVAVTSSKNSAEQQQCTRALNDAAPAMSPMCVPTTNGAPAPVSEEILVLRAKVAAKLAEIENEDAEMAVLKKRLETSK